MYYNTNTPKPNEVPSRISNTTPSRNDRQLANTDGKVGLEQYDRNAMTDTKIRTTNMAPVTQFNPSQDQNVRYVNKDAPGAGQNTIRVTDMAPPDPKKTHESRVSRRGSVYSYNGDNESMLEKIVNDEYTSEMDSMPGLRKYINECRKQIAVAKDLKMYLLTQPFLGTQVVLPPKTDSKRLARVCPTHT